YETLGIKRDKPFIVSFGGSGGQKSLNNSILESLEDFSRADYQVLHITGKNNYDKFLNDMLDKGIKASDDIRIVSYFNEMPKALNLADLVITSGGAITLAEISAIGVPGILIPKAYTA